MSQMLGIALALAVGWNGTNGFDPDDLLLVLSGPDYQVEVTPKFKEWFLRDPTNNAELVRYLVRCGLPRGSVVRLGDLWSWPGELGLAAPRPIPSLDGKYRLLLRGRGDEADPGRWVSACVLAHANVRLYHQFFSIRGNPSSPAARSVLEPTSEERWTEGHPEGVFFGNLFDPPARTGEDLKSFTVSLNLPESYAPQTAHWRPPNAVVGRTLDFDRETRAARPQGKPVRIAARLGTYNGHRASFRASANRLDPDYDADTVCLDGQHKLRACPGNPADPAWAKTEILRPLFVHLPRLANLESVETLPDARTPFQVLGRGLAVGSDQVVACAPGNCVGPFPYLKAGGGVAHPSRPGEGAKLVGLKKGQILEPTLRFIASQEAAGLEMKASGQSFTAIVRYSCREETCNAVVSAKAKSAGSKDDWSEFGHRWPSTGSSDVYRWLQVYPVYLPADGAETALRIQIEGAEGPAPELDAVGFVPGAPRCLGEFRPPVMKDAPFMGVCLEP